MPDLDEEDLIFRYGIVNAMYPLSGMIFAPLFGWLETAGVDENDGNKLRRKGIVRKIGITSTFAFCVGNLLYATISYISEKQDIRFTIILIARIVAGIASGRY